MSRIVSDDGIRSGQPRVEGTRVTVLDIKRRVVDEDEDPGVVAGEYDIPMAALFEALAYYYDNRESLGECERTAAEARRTGEGRTAELLAAADPEEPETGERAD
jgi:uncharacterized protein (DUF433 family)